MFLPVLDQAVVKRIVLQEVQRNNEAENAIDLNGLGQN